MKEGILLKVSGTLTIKEEVWEESTTGGSWAHLITQTHRDNSHMRATNSENEPKDQQNKFAQLMVERRAHQKG